MFPLKIAEFGQFVKIFPSKFSGSQFVYIIITGTCLSFSHEDKNLFVVGAENGTIFKCSMQTTTIESIGQSTGEPLCVCVDLLPKSTINSCSFIWLQMKVTSSR